MVDTHDCVFNEIEIEEGDFDEGDNLKVGMKVLLPCLVCGFTASEHMGMLEMYFEEATKALTESKPTLPLFHWAPTSRRKQIIRHGLRPFMRKTTSTGDDTEKYNVVCFADSPSWAWALSGGMKWTPEGEWDLWQTSLDRINTPVVMPGDFRESGIYEVRTEYRVYKRHLWYVATRLK
jgi:hypothetical protein